MEWESTNKSPQVGFSKGSVLVVTPSLSLVSTNPKPNPKDCLLTTASLRYIFSTFSALAGMRFGGIHFWRGQNKAVPSPQCQWQNRPNHPIICTLTMSWSSVHSPEGGWQGENSSHHTGLFRSLNSMQLWHSRGSPSLHSVLHLCQHIWSCILQI